MAKSRKIPFVVDAVALLGKESFRIEEGISAMAFSGHKIHALQGCGLAFIRANMKFLPLLTGGGQEFGSRAGTENFLGILSLADAFSLLQHELESYAQKMRKMRTQFEESLLSKIPGILINGEGPRVSNVSNLAFPEVDGESLLIALDRAGIAASHGSACSTGALEPSHVLLNMGLERERVHASLRFSLAASTRTRRSRLPGGLSRILSLKLPRRDRDSFNIKKAGFLDSQFKGRDENRFSLFRVVSEAMLDQF